MDSRDFLQTARQLIDLPFRLESNYRTSISRSYYSAFLRFQFALSNQVSARLLKQAQISQLGHEWIISALSRSETNEVAAIGMMLHNLRSWRHRADYNLREEFVESEATEQLKHAEEIHAAIDAFGLPKIIAYMIQHIRNLAQLRMGTSSI